MKKWFFFSLISILFALAPGKSSAASDCGQTFVCHEALLKFSRHASDAHVQEILAQEGLTVIRYFPRSRLYHVGLSPSEDTLQKIEALSRREFILAASPNGIVHAELLPDDPRFNEQWALKNTGQSGGMVGADIGVEEVWDQLTDTSDPVIVAVIDSGMDYGHPDLAANVWTNAGEIPGNDIDDDGNGYVDDVHGYDFFNQDGDPMDDNAHGTHVSGIIGAVGNNAIGVSGVAWRTRIMALKFLDENGFGTMADAAEATEYAIDNGAKILNNSWGVGFTSTPLLSAITSSDDAGVIYAAAAGNFGNNNDAHPFYPANYNVPNVVSVAAVTRFETLASFSSYGKLTVDLGAPGVSILSTVPTWYRANDDDYEFFDGTSMATPYVVGAAAMLWSAYPGYNHRQILQLLLQGAAPKSYLNDITVSGGALYLEGAFQLAEGLVNRPPVVAAGPDQFKKVGETVQLQASATDEDGDTPLFFEWTLLAPPGSHSTLGAANIANPAFVPDTEGTYVATVVANDAKDLSLPDAVTIEVSGENFPPPNVVIALEKKTASNPSLAVEAGGTVDSGDTVFIDGQQSSGLFPYKLLYEWALMAKPEGSQTQIAQPGQERTSFSPDLPGVYTVRLSVEDGFHESFGEASIQVKATAAANPPDSSQPASGGCSLMRR